MRHAFTIALPYVIAVSTAVVIISLRESSAVSVMIATAIPVLLDDLREMLADSRKLPAPGKRKKPRRRPV